MQPIEIKNANLHLHPPSTWDKEQTGVECVVLHAHAQRDGDTWHMTSAWKPSADELAALNAGHGVMLTVWGFAHPPVMLQVTGEPL